MFLNNSLALGEFADFEVGSRQGKGFSGMETAGNTSMPLACVASVDT
jgi:hypothetical protein